MFLVELIRLIIVVSLTLAGYRVGGSLPRFFEPAAQAPETALLLSTTVGAALGYVLGGVLGRGLLKAVGAVERSADRFSGAELVAGGVGIVAGSAGAALTGWVIIALLPYHLFAYTLAALVFILAAYTGYRISLRKRFEVLGMMGLSQARNFRAPIQRLTMGPKVIDTSVLIDGRIVDVARSGFITGHLICPRFVLAELSSIAESADPTRRARGQRGLAILEALESEARIRLEIAEDPVTEVGDVDGKLVVLSERVGGMLVTNDFNLHKNAELHGVPVLNVNNLAAALKPVVLPGEELAVSIVKGGTQPGQGVGYLEDGTMVVVEGAGALIGSTAHVVVTSVLQTSSGRMLFSALKPSGTSEPAHP